MLLFTVRFENNPLHTAPGTRDLYRFRLRSHVISQPALNVARVGACITVRDSRSNVSTILQLFQHPLIRWFDWGTRHVGLVCLDARMLVAHRFQP